MNNYQSRTVSEQDGDFTVSRTRTTDGKDTFVITAKDGGSVMTIQLTTDAQKRAKALAKLINAVADADCSIPDVKPGEGPKPK